MWSALGSPPRLPRRPQPASFAERKKDRVATRVRRRRDVELAGPPEKINHDIVLVNWSRMSRSGPAMLWYLAFPYTLINTAYEMRPSSYVRRVIHVALVVFAALLLTVVTTCWTTAIVELVVQEFAQVSEVLDEYRREISIVVSAGLLLSVVLTRVLQESESHAHTLHALGHSVVIIGISVVGYMCRFPDWQVGERSWVRAFSTRFASEVQLDRDDFDSIPASSFPVWLDPIGFIAITSLAIMLIIALAILFNSSRRERGPSAGAAIAILLSFTLFTLIMSGLRAGLTQLFQLSWWRTFGLEDFAAGVSPDMVWTVRYNVDSHAVFTLPLICLIMIAVIVLALAASLGVHRLLFWLPSRDHRLEIARWTHESVGRISSILLLASIIIITLGSALIAFGVFVLFRIQIDVDRCDIEGICYAPYYNFVYYGATAAGAIAIFSVQRIHSTPALKKTIASVGDIAGFWPITIQPFGARTCRPYVVDGILDALTRKPGAPTILVGHSQGSVLAAWTVSRLPTSDIQDSIPSMQNLWLVTCGSPLQSLYATFFPAVFDPAWFTQVEERVRAWANFWRNTDPIATELPYPKIDNVNIADPHPRDIEDSSDGPVRGHSDYWIAPEQKAWISKTMKGANLYPSYRGTSVLPVSETDCIDKLRNPGHRVSD